MRLKDERVESVVIVTTRRNGLTRLRRMYFAQAAEPAARYNISFDRVVTHLWEVRKANPAFRLREIECVGDLVHAIACYDGVNHAWSDLVQRFEPTLLEQCSKAYDEANSVAMVRKLFIDLRKSHRKPTVKERETLKQYTGSSPLKRWMIDRLNALRTRAALELLQRRRQWVACSFGPRFFR